MKYHTKNIDINIPDKKHLLECSHCNDQMIFLTKNDINYCHNCDKNTDWIDSIENQLQYIQSQFDIAIERTKNINILMTMKKDFNI